jgi:NAD(P)-dependent dehydrogenase (short-subunit alcohol dehydrogenase family)
MSQFFEEADMGTSASDIENKIVMVTGANRGIGQALVDEALTRNASRVYAAARRPFEHGDPRVRPLTIDLVDAAQIRRAADEVGELDILVNNAGVSVAEDLSDRSLLEHHLAVNLYGTLEVTSALLPALKRSGGSLVNVASLAAIAAVPVLPAYSISKAALLSLTQSLRARLAAAGVRVHAVLPGPVDTEMSRDLDLPKAAPAAVAAAVLDGVCAGEEEIFPDAMAADLAESWRTGATKQFERQNATLLGAAPLAA